MSDIKLEPQEADHISQDSLIRSISPLQEHKSGILPTTGNVHHEAKREDTPMIVGEGGVQDAPYNPHHPTGINVPSHTTTDFHPPPSYPVPVVQHVHHNVGHVQGVPGRQQVVYPVNQPNGEFCYARQRVIPGPAQVAVPYPPAHPLAAPTRGLPASENLRRLANHYVQHPGSRVTSVSMERGTAGRFKVTIALEVSDIL